MNPLRKYLPEAFVLDVETFLSHVNYDQRYNLMRVQAADRVRRSRR